MTCFSATKGQEPYKREALYNQKTQEVYFLASNQCGLSVGHACLFDMIKDRKYDDKK